MINCVQLAILKAVGVKALHLSGVVVWKALHNPE